MKYLKSKIDEFRRFLFIKYFDIVTILLIVLILVLIRYSIKAYKKRNKDDEE